MDPLLKHQVYEDWCKANGIDNSNM